MCIGAPPRTQIVPDTAESVMQFDIVDGDGGIVARCYNKLHFTLSGGWDAASLQDLSGALSARWNIGLRDYQHYLCMLVNVVSHALVLPPTLYYEARTNITGTAVGSLLATNAAPVVTFRTGIAGRSYRGRLFFPGMAASFVTHNMLRPEYQAAWLDAAREVFTATASDVGATHVVVSRCHGGEWRVVGEATDVQGYASDFVVHSQRRRLTLD